MKTDVVLEHSIISLQPYTDANNCPRLRIVFLEFLEQSKVEIDLDAYVAINLVFQTVQALRPFVDLSNPQNLNRIDRILSDVDELFELVYKAEQNN